MSNLIYIGCFLIGVLIGSVILFLSVKTAKKSFDKTMEDDEKEWDNE